MRVLKKDGTNKKLDVSKISKFFDWSNDPKSDVPDILEKIHKQNIIDDDISEKIILESIQRKNF